MIFSEKMDYFVSFFFILVHCVMRFGATEISFENDRLFLRPKVEHLIENNF